MQRCWSKEPSKRPTFQEIVTILRELSMQNPSYGMSAGVNTRTAAPSGKIYLVHTV